MLVFGKLLIRSAVVVLALSVGWFGFRVIQYYSAIRSGKTNPLLEQRLDSSLSRLRANQAVTSEDLKRLHPPTAPAFGNPAAKLVVVEFIDFDCPYSLQAFSVVREAMERYRDRVYLMIRDFPIEELHPDAFKAALAARCAQDQGKFWAYHDKLFANQSRRSDEDLQQFARETGLDGAVFSTCLKERRHATQIQSEIADGLRAGVQGTPTFFFNGLKVQGALDRQTFELLIKKSLEQSTS